MISAQVSTHARTSKSRRPAPTDRHIITVDYNKPLKDMIAAGRYDYVEEDLTPRRFQVKGTGIVRLEPKLFHFEGRTFKENAIDLIVGLIKADDKDNPWEPATIEALLAYGAKHPRKQLKHSIMAFGSVVKIGKYYAVPSLERDGVRWDERNLIFHYCHFACGDDGRFLAVRKLSSAA